MDEWMNEWIIHYGLRFQCATTPDERESISPGKLPTFYLVHSVRWSQSALTDHGWEEISTVYLVDGDDACM